MKSEWAAWVKRRIIMHDYEYVPKEIALPIKNDIIELIKHVQNEIRDNFTFRFDFIGSAKRNMITCDFKSNIGFDFDVNIEVNDDDVNFTPKEIKHILMRAFNKHVYGCRYDHCEDSTRVFTIKVKDKSNFRILYSCDFAIVNNYGKNRQQYIRFNKKQNSYSWEEQPKSFYDLPNKIEFCKSDPYLWNEVRDLYLDKKNFNNDTYKKSRSIFAETIHEICQQNGYYKR